MSAHALSRYRWSSIFVDEANRRFFGPRPRFEYQDLPDNKIHTVREGERLWHVAQIHFRGFARAGNLWWVIADFQPQPIHDPTLALEPGTYLVVPSLRTVEGLVFTADRELPT
jgi:hypothetical protein